MIKNILLFFAKLKKQIVKILPSLRYGKAFEITWFKLKRVAQQHQKQKTTVTKSRLRSSRNLSKGEAHQPGTFYPGVALGSLGAGLGGP